MFETYTPFHEFVPLSFNDVSLSIMRYNSLSLGRFMTSKKYLIMRVFHRARDYNDMTHARERGKE